jgi:hypothetical protein
MVVLSDNKKNVAVSLILAMLCLGYMYVLITKALAGISLVIYEFAHMLF